MFIVENKNPYVKNKEISIAHSKLSQIMKNRVNYTSTERQPNINNNITTNHTRSKNDFNHEAVSQISKIFEKKRKSSVSYNDSYRDK